MLCIIITIILYVCSGVAVSSGGSVCVYVQVDLCVCVQVVMCARSQLELYAC